METLWALALQAFDVLVHLDDYLAWVVEHYPDLVRAALRQAVA